MTYRTTTFGKTFLARSKTFPTASEASELLPVNLIFPKKYLAKKHLRRRSNCSAKISNRRKAVIKLAKKCVRKFENKTIDESSAFLTYCTKRIRSQFNTAIPTDEEIAVMKKTLNIYDQMYYGFDALEECLLNSTINSIDETNIKKDLNGQRVNVVCHFGLLDFQEFESMCQIFLRTSKANVIC